jgi:hypothetical protein
MSYSNLIPVKRVKNIVYLLLNNAQMTNPTTLFTKDNLTGAFAGYNNLLPLINKFEKENCGGKIPIKTIKRDLEKIGKDYTGVDGMKKHMESLNRRYGK